VQQQGKKQFWITTPQLAALGIISLSLAALAFFLGLMVGRGQAPSDPQGGAIAQASIGLISAEMEEDSITELLARVEQAAAEHAPLEFPQALTEDTPQLRLPVALPEEEEPIAVLAADESAQPDAPTPAPVVEEAVPAPPKKGWVVQVASFPRPEQAEERWRAVRAAGHSNTFLVHALVKGQTWYRVRIGPYESERAANKAKAELSQSLGQQDLLVTEVR
jgi:cell division septation protein DedD